MRQKDPNGRIRLKIAKVTDYLLMAGYMPGMEHLFEELEKGFKTIRVIIHNEVDFDGCVIRQDDAGNTTLDMTR